VASWIFLTNHARVLLCVAHDPGVRLRDMAASLDITERSAFGIIMDLAEAGYVVKEKDGRRNRYHVQAHLPLPELASRDHAVGEILALLADAGATGDLSRAIRRAWVRIGLRSADRPGERSKRKAMRPNGSWCTPSERKTGASGVY
jgi:hypothetical protein